MRTRLLLSFLVAALAVPVASFAQYEGERGLLGEFVTWRVAPEAATDFEAAIIKVVEAAKLANLAEEHAWFMWQDGFDYALYGPTNNFAEFDDPEAWMRAFQGTPGEAMLMEAMEAFGSLDYQVLSREVIEQVPGWDYQVEEPYDVKYAHMYESWMKPGTEMQADEISREWVAMLTELGYPYEAAGFRVHFGDVGRLVYITWYDDQADYYGPKAQATLVEAKGGGEKWQDLGNRWNALITRYEESTWAFRADMSYGQSM